MTMSAAALTGGSATASADRDRVDRLLAAFDSMRRVSNELSSAGAARSGLAVSDLRALVVVQREVGIKPGALAAQLGLTPSGMTAVIDRLEGAGTLRRLADPADRRSQRLEVTAAGEDALEVVRTDYVEVFLGALSPEEVELVEPLFVRLADSFEAVRARRRV
jgi:DNA-binding MarR family transcriptional regulator